MSAAARRSIHVPVMPREVLRELQLLPGLTVLDGTVGAGGHTSLILKAIAPTGRVVGLDRDPMMLQLAAERVHGLPCTLVNDSYIHSIEVLKEAGIGQVDRVLLDLGLSSDQLADRERGFGFDAGGPLDMRFNPQSGASAAELLARLSVTEIERVLTDYGDEPRAAKIAAEIVSRRDKGCPVETAQQLEECVARCAGLGRSGSGKNPATRTFQALRIATNQELQHVEQMVNVILPRVLKPLGIAVIITFHSIEDRLVKSAFKGQQGWQVLTKSPVQPAPAEVRLNPRSRSAQIRAARWQPDVS